MGDDEKSVELQAIEEIIQALESMAESQRNLCAVASQVLSELQQANRQAKKKPRRALD